MWIVLLDCPVIRMIQINARSFLIYTENNEILRMLTFFFKAKPEPHHQKYTLCFKGKLHIYIVNTSSGGVWHAGWDDAASVKTRLSLSHIGNRSKQQNLLEKKGLC